MRTCKVCQKTKPETAEYFRPIPNGYLLRTCRACQYNRWKDRQKEYRAENLDMVRELARQAHKKRYYEDAEYREQMIQRAIQYRINNPDKAKKYRQRYYQKLKSDPERYKTYLQNHNRKLRNRYQTDAEYREYALKQNREYRQRKKAETNGNQ